MRPAAPAAAGLLVIAIILLDDPQPLDIARDHAVSGLTAALGALGHHAAMSLDPGRGATLPAGPVQMEIGAPAALVRQMLAAIGQGVQRPGERAVVLERDGDRLVADFWTPVRLPLGRRRIVRTREAVSLASPDRVEYEHLDGPLRGLREAIAVHPVGAGRCRIVYEGAYPPRGWLDRTLYGVVARRSLERAVRAHLEDLRPRAEARAARSRVFPPDPA